MAKRRGLLQHAAKAVKQQKQHQHQHQKHHTGAPAVKKQKTGPSSNSKLPPDSKHSQNGRPPQQQQHQKPIIPFSPTDSILLVGEGDLSFAASLVTHHKCTNVTATVLEKDLAELSTKYPHVSSNIAQIEQSPGCRVLYGVDARKLPPFTTKPSKSSSGPPTGAMKRIMFNFPHTGGKSTDVNRQVRYNQELLVDFFRSAQRSLSPDRTAAIVVTLFEGEPYTLWNVRDLARHAGLQVETSFRFVASAYPGYAHARTLGVVRNRKGEVSKSAWKGEERPARSYVFVRKGEGGLDLLGHGKGKRGKKRRRGSDESESESESESDGESEVGQQQELDDEGEPDEEEEDEDSDDGAEGANDPDNESANQAANSDAAKASQDSRPSSSDGGGESQDSALSSRGS
ncbi:hypothetical protein VTJ49DRAFT_364 [Mycothermus thermophilus]|uniref:25S rRNA (uridine-N(3))-methyltransferase BMT5-like domain-containing protein n=1 Tax=Humicola insolens TaxID=85995 RepID=A0ABR3VQ28_HUMIN